MSKFNSVRLSKSQATPESWMLQPRGIGTACHGPSNSHENQAAPGVDDSWLFYYHRLLAKSGNV